MHVRLCLYVAMVGVTKRNALFEALKTRSLSKGIMQKWRHNRCERKVRRATADVPCKLVGEQPPILFLSYLSFSLLFYADLQSPCQPRQQLGSTFIRPLNESVERDSGSDRAGPLGLHAGATHREVSNSSWKDLADLQKPG